MNKYSKYLATILSKAQKEKIKNSFIYNVLFDLNSKKYYSQEGEDIFILNFFPENHQGFYLDIGAHHPFSFSNTALLYEKGWRGINIDAFPNSMLPFQKHRKEDINLEFGISPTDDYLDFYIFKEKGLNTFDAKTYEMQVANGKVFEEVKKVKCVTFNSVIKNHLNNNHNIDLITIDIEGYELGVIKSIDFSKINPKLFIIEFIEASIPDVLNSEINKILNENGFIFIASLGNSQIFSKGGLKHLR